MSFFTLIGIVFTVIFVVSVVLGLIDAVKELH